MAIAAITSWLTKPNLASGLILYKKFIKNSARLFYYQSEIYPLSDLIEELTEYNNLATEPEQKKDNKKDYPPTIRELDELGSKAWKERNYLRSIILLEPLPEKRKIMAFRILECTDNAFDAWNKVAHWKETGELPFKMEHKVTADDLFTLIEKIKHIPTYLSKLKKKLEDNPDAMRYAELMEKKAKHLSDLESANQRLTFLNDKIIELCL